MKQHTFKPLVIASSIFCSIIALDTRALNSMLLPYNQINDTLSYQLAQQQVMILLNRRDIEDRDYKKIDTLFNKMAYFDRITKEKFINICFIASLFGPLNFYTHHAVNKLIKLGANVNQTYTYYVAHTKIKRTNPLLLAAENRPASVIGLLLLHGADVMALDNDGNTALIMAARKNKFEAVDLLIQTLENNIHQRAQKRGLLPCSTALQQATDDWQNCPLEVINCCISPFLPSDATQYATDIAAYINHQNYLGNTALTYAATNNHYPMVEYLIKHGADARIKNKAGLTAYGYAGRDDIRKMLQEAL